MTGLSQCNTHAQKLSSSPSESEGEKEIAVCGRVSSRHSAQFLSAVRHPLDTSKRAITRFLLNLPKRRAGYSSLDALYLSLSSAKNPQRIAILREERKRLNVSSSRTGITGLLRRSVCHTSSSSNATIRKETHLVQQHAQLFALRYIFTLYTAPRARCRRRCSPSTPPPFSAPRGWGVGETSTTKGSILPLCLFALSHIPVFFTRTRGKDTTRRHFPPPAAGFASPRRSSSYARTRTYVSVLFYTSPGPVRPPSSRSPRPREGAFCPL